MGELFFLFPPRVPVVAHEVLIFLQGWIIVRRQHLTVCIDVDAGTLRLLEEVSEVVQVVSTDEDAGPLAYPDVHFCQLRMAVSCRVGLVEECHDVDTVFSGLKQERQQVVG